jgi:GNAT superfamily N-acetyltransferase
VADEFHGAGVGRLLFLHLTQMAWARGVRTVELLISAGNTKMLNMVKHFGHVISRIPEAGAYHIRCSLDNPGDSLWEH